MTTELTGTFSEKTSLSCIFMTSRSTSRTVCSDAGGLGPSLFFLAWPLSLPLSAEREREKKKKNADENHKLQFKQI